MQTFKYLDETNEQYESRLRSLPRILRPEANGRARVFRNGASFWTTESMFKNAEQCASMNHPDRMGLLKEDELEHLVLEAQAGCLFHSTPVNELPL